MSEHSGYTCASCRQDYVGESIHVSHLSEEADLCSVECLMVYAAQKLTGIRESRERRIAELERQVTSAPSQCPHCFQAL